MNDFDRLNAILKNSFAAIKLDMDELKDFRAQQLKSSYEQKQEMDKVKEDYVAKDRLNLLKIKIGEINDSLKKVWDIEENLKKLDANKVPKSLFDQKVQELNSEINKRVTEIKLSVSQLREDSKQFISKTQVKELIDDINGEFNIVHKEVAELKSRKEMFSVNEVKRRNEELNKKLDLLAKELVDTNKKLALMIKKDQVEDLVKQINLELDDIKVEMNEVYKLKKYVSFVESDMIKEKDLRKSTKDLEGDIIDLRDELSDLKRGVKKDIENKVKVVEKEIIVKDNKRAESRPKIESRQKLVIKEDEKEKKPYRKTMIFGNLLIGLAFALLIFAIIAFFAVEPVWADALSVVSIISFVIGILLRVIVVLKRK
jgi:hypothetical protein